ncbi:UPF0481 protein At3g47200-like [Nicotiana tabacum]|uniref:UPF0481 protein At3g47200-like n=1 Tax=Nicotiana tabacum TaxID=4097 RepID=A0A1S4BFH6_TOBAC|nr:PREDICTED: UPF0481 protein At3g47200-like [Nicotiana tabacum]
MDKQSAKGTKVTREEGWNVGNEKFADINPEEWSITFHQESNSTSHEISENERKWLCSVENSPAIGSSEKPKIQMVPKMHRENEANRRCYEPLVVAIGPFHHEKSKLQPMEKYKVLLANQFAKESSKEKSVSIDVLYTRVKDIVPSARDCYAKDSIKDYNDEEFAKMMFLDGCFILQYIHCLVTRNYKQLQMKSHDIAFIRRDLFLLENQLPFEVLHVLMSCRFKKDEGMEMIKTFISSAHAKPLQSHGLIQNIKYLFLDFFGKISEREKPSLTQEETSKNQIPAHLLEILRAQLIDPNAFSEGGCYLRGEWCSYRSARELSRAGIHFECGKRRCLSDIKFNSFRFSALLTLPPITIDDSTKSELLNLVAYEACPDTPDDFGVTSYLCLMDSLIDHAEDVKELRSKGILLNFLGSDQEVANLFNEIATDLVPNPHAFIDVKHKIENHYNNKGKVWVAEWKNTHFDSPWTVVAFIAAIFLILLQVADTVLAAFQVKFAEPPK